MLAVHRYRAAEKERERESRGGDLPNIYKNTGMHAYLELKACSDRLLLLQEQSMQHLSRNDTTTISRYKFLAAEH